MIKFTFSTRRNERICQRIWPIKISKTGKHVFALHDVHSSHHRAWDINRINKRPCDLGNRVLPQGSQILQINTQMSSVSPVIYSSTCSMTSLHFYTPVIDRMNCSFNHYSTVHGYHQQMSVWDQSQLQHLGGDVMVWEVWAELPTGPQPGLQVHPISSRSPSDVCIHSSVSYLKYCKWVCFIWAAVDYILTQYFHFCPLKALSYYRLSDCHYW